MASIQVVVFTAFWIFLDCLACLRTRMTLPELSVLCHFLKQNGFEVSSVKVIGIYFSVPTKDEGNSTLLQLCLMVIGAQKTREEQLGRVCLLQIHLKF